MKVLKKKEIGFLCLISLLISLTAKWIQLDSKWDKINNPESKGRNLNMINSLLSSVLPGYDSLVTDQSSKPTEVSASTRAPNNKSEKASRTRETRSDEGLVSDSNTEMVQPFENFYSPYDKNKLEDNEVLSINQSLYYFDDSSFDYSNSTFFKISTKLRGIFSQFSFCLKNIKEYNSFAVESCFGSEFSKLNSRLHYLSLQLTSRLETSIKTIIFNHCYLKADSNLIFNSSCETFQTDLLDLVTAKLDYVSVMIANTDKYTKGTGRLSLKVFERMVRKLETVQTNYSIISQEIENNAQLYIVNFKKQISELQNTTAVSTQSGNFVSSQYLSNGSANTGISNAPIDQLSNKGDTQDLQMMSGKDNYSSNNQSNIDSEKNKNRVLNPEDVDSSNPVDDDVKLSKAEGEKVGSFDKRTMFRNKNSRSLNTNKKNSLQSMRDKYLRQREKAATLSNDRDSIEVLSIL